MTKQELADKIAKEQNLDAKKLMRLTVAELEKMDIVVPDDGDLLGEDPILSDFESEPELPIITGHIGEVGEITTDSKSETTDTLSTSADSGAGTVSKNPRFFGYHPVTGEEVYL